MDANHSNKFDAVAFIMEYESETGMDEGTMIAGFQHLVDSGLVWQLQGSYGRMAVALIEAGLVEDRR